MRDGEQEEVRRRRIVVYMENDLTDLFNDDMEDADVLRCVTEHMSPAEVIDGAQWRVERRDGRS